MIRPYGGGPPGSSQHRGASEPRGQVSIFGGGDPFAGGPFAGGRDPFQGFGGFGGMGGDPFGGGIMQRFEEMTRDMMGGVGGPGGMAAGGRGGGGGSYTCQTFAMSSVMGPDGKMHTERYASSDIGNRDHGIREAQHAYSNSSTGIDKMGMERQLGERARKMVKERDRRSMEERSTEMFRGMDESGRQAFDRDFSGQAQHLPQHPRFSPATLQHPGRSSLGDGRSPQGGRSQQPALGGGEGSYGGQRHRSMPGARRR